MSRDWGITQAVDLAESHRQVTTSMSIPLPRVPGDQRPRPVQVAAEVLGVRAVGAYREFTLHAPRVAPSAEPGQFITLGVGGDDSALLLRRAFALSGAGGETISIVVAAHGPGTRWIYERRAGNILDLIGPLGRAFPPPPPGGSALLVAGGYGAAPFVGLAQRLLSLGHAVAAVVGAGSADRLCAVEELATLTRMLAVTTEDGTAGRTGRVTDVVPELLAGASTVYACGPMSMLRAVSAQAADRGLVCHVAVEEAMACGIGVCMTCVLPVVGKDGTSRFVRSCVEGPVFEGAQVRFDDIGRLPEDLYGAAGMRAAR
ncbi:MAG: dihydroorotate dehydrogenase electron transfer subunit [Actinomycetota bacterium]|nr:dihydroorotate dehydrogenase electron transfer subunit [Actinomycetota bacterium]